MNSAFDKRIKLFQKVSNLNLLCCNLRGIEREALRVTELGEISQEPHPEALGSALTHPHITTDYSEALLEFITEPFPKIDSVMGQLSQVHRVTAHGLPQNQHIWPSSMPCILGDDEGIPIAQYGNSNVGEMKTIYRRGLGHRYGRKMQTIAGIHFNFSVSDAVWSQMRANDNSLLSIQDYRTTGYMGLVRNFRRRFWLLLYLMGASPVADKSFVEGRQHNLQVLNKRDLYLPEATSLRMGDLGYQSSAQDGLYVCYNSVHSYVKSLQQALLKEYEPYKDFDCTKDNQLQQLSSAVLQIENEFYSTIRPKQTTRSGETQLKALKERGIEYIEVRCIDINPFEPLGINEEQIDFIELFLLGCLFDDSPDTLEQEYREVLENQDAVVRMGRKPNLNLTRQGVSIPMQNWAAEIIDQLDPITEIMDKLCGENRYSQVLENMRSLLVDPDKTPSARLLQELNSSQSSFVEWSLEKARQHQNTLTEHELAADVKSHFEKIRLRSFNDQSNIEANQNETLSSYIGGYFEQYRQL